MTLQPSLLFETPLILEQFDAGPDILSSLLALAAERRPPEAGAWETDHRMLRWGGEAAIALLEACVHLADRHTADIGAPAGQTRFGWSADLRTQFAGDDGRIAQQAYAAPYWSILLATGARLVLEDPRMPMIGMEDPGLRIRKRPAGPSLAVAHALPLDAGTLVMFPAWLRRRVEFGDATGHRGLLTLNLTAFLASAPAAAGELAS